MTTRTACSSAALVTIAAVLSAATLGLATGGLTAGRRLAGDGESRAHGSAIDLCGSQ